MRKKLAVLSLVLGVAVLVGVLGVGAAFAQTPQAGTDWHSSVTSRVAEILGVSEQELNDAYKQAHAETLDEAVATGQISQEQANLMKEHMADGTFGPGGRMGGAFMGGHAGGRMGGHFGGQFGMPWAQPSQAPVQ